MTTRLQDEAHKILHTYEKMDTINPTIELCQIWNDDDYLIVLKVILELR